MSKKIASLLFNFYHALFLSRNASCRFIPTCSQYSLEAIGKYGVFKGAYLSLKRLLSCQPFSKRPIYDPV